MLLFISLQLKGTTYYISPNGNNGGNGSFYSPWKTLAHASTNVKNGDIIYAESGTYIEVATSDIPVGVRVKGEGLNTIFTTDTLTAPIIRLKSPIGTVGNNIISDIKVDGKGISKIGIHIEGRSNVEITGVFLTNFATCTAWRNTCVLAIFGEYMSDIEIHHSTIQGTVHLFYFDNIDIHHNIIGYPVMSPDFKDGIYTCDVDGLTIRNNYFKNLATQISVASYPDTRVQNIFIFNNVMFNIGVASDEWYGSGIDMGGITSQPAQNIIIANNTMIANPQNRKTRIGIYLPTVGYTTNIVIQNNIMTGFRYATIFGVGPDRVIDAISIENNIFWDNTSDPAQTYCTSDSVYYTNIELPLNETSNYMFVDPIFMGTEDFHLSEFSPAIRNGISIPIITTDYDDKIRSEVFDIGAYMYGETTEIIENETMGFLVYPVPFYDKFTFAIDNPNFTKLRMEINNIQGVVVYKKQITEPISVIDLSDAHSGIYIVTILGTRNEIISAIKIIKN